MNGDINVINYEIFLVPTGKNHPFKKCLKLFKPNMKNSIDYNAGSKILSVRSGGELLYKIQSVADQTVARQMSAEINNKSIHVAMYFGLWRAANDAGRTGSFVFNPLAFLDGIMIRDGVVKRPDKTYSEHNSSRNKALRRFLSLMSSVRIMCTDKNEMKSVSVITINGKTDVPASSIKSGVIIRIDPLIYGVTAGKNRQYVLMSAAIIKRAVQDRRYQLILLGYYLLRLLRINAYKKDRCISINAGTLFKSIGLNVNNKTREHAKLIRMLQDLHEVYPCSTSTQEIDGNLITKINICPTALFLKDFDFDKPKRRRQKVAKHV